MAAPLVAGVAARLRAIRPSMGQDAIRAHLAATARDLGAPGHDPVYGWGEIDPVAAFALAPEAVTTAAVTGPDDSPVVDVPLRTFEVKVQRFVGGVLIEPLGAARDLTVEVNGLRVASGAGRRAPVRVYLDGPTVVTANAVDRAGQPFAPVVLTAAPLPAPRLELTVVSRPRGVEFSLRVPPVLGVRVVSVRALVGDRSEEFRFPLRSGKGVRLVRVLGGERYRDATLQACFAVAPGRHVGCVDAAATPTR